MTRALHLQFLFRFWSFMIILPWSLSLIVPRQTSSKNSICHDQETPEISRRNLFLDLTTVTAACASSTMLLPVLPAFAGGPRLDVNNALAREYTAFPGLYPTIATKLVNAVKDEGAFANKKEMYAILNELEQERLKQYDKDIVISPIDKSLQQFKTSQICKYECGNRSSSAYRDEEIKRIQNERR